MKDKRIKIISMVAYFLIALVLYIILHELGHCIVAVACGATITEFSILTAHMSYVGGSYTDASDLWLHVNGMLFPLTISYIYMIFYNSDKGNLTYRIVSYVISFMPMFSLLPWVIMPIMYAVGESIPATDDVTKFLYNFSASYNPIWVTVGAVILIATSIIMIIKKRILHNFIVEMKK